MHFCKRKTHSAKMSRLGEITHFEDYVAGEVVFQVDGWEAGAVPMDAFGKKKVGMYDEIKDIIARAYKWGVADARRVERK